MKFSEKLQILLKEKKWTQKKLAEESDLSAMTISRWMKKKTKPEWDSLNHIAEATGYNVDWLDEDDYEGPKFEKDVWVFEAEQSGMNKSSRWLNGFYERITELMMSLEINEAQLLAISGIDKTLSKRWDFFGVPSPQEVERIAEATGYNADWLWYETSPKRVLGAKEVKIPKVTSAMIEQGSNEEKAINRNIHLRQIIEWMDAEFGEDDEEALFFYEELKDKYKSFADFMEKKRPGGSKLPASTKDEKLRSA